MAVNPTLPASLADEIRDLKRRIENLEKSPKIPFSSTKGGLFKFLDDGGTTRLAIGNAILDGTDPTGSGLTGAYGVAQSDENGAIIAMQATGYRGTMYPNHLIPFHDPTSKTTTSASFVSMFESYAYYPPHEVLTVFGAVQTDSGTAGELRLSCGSSHTNTLTLASATNNAYLFEWLHPLTCGVFDSRPGRDFQGLLVLEARRTSGTGNVRIFPPQIAAFTSTWFLPDADTNGNPVLQ